MDNITDKQKYAINIICYELHLNFKKWQIENMSRYDASVFIHEHEDVLRKAKQRHRDIIRERQAAKRKTYYSDNSFAGPYGTDIVDCYDFNICPCGDS